MHIFLFSSRNKIFELKGKGHELSHVENPSTRLGLIISSPVITLHDYILLFAIRLESVFTYLVWCCCESFLEGYDLTWVFVRLYTYIKGVTKERKFNKFW